MLPLLAERNIQDAVHASVLPSVVHAERDRLTQVLVNLVANAVRFTETGGKISMGTNQRDSVLELHVSDNGIRIAPEKLEAIFQPFVQAETGSSRRAQGTGLGLTISRRLAEAMGGTLTVKSAPGEGSTFTLSLQVAHSPISDRGPIRGSHTAQSATVIGREPALS